MDSKSSIDIIRELAQRVVDNTSLELVHVEIDSTRGGRTVRIFIDRETGVTHEDCALVSQQVEQALDREDPISGKYLLEVSSPGIERGLYSPDDFEKFTGSAVKIRTNKALEGQRNFRGVIKGVSGDSILVKDLTSGDRTIEFASIEKANLEFDAAKELRKSPDNKKRGG